ncbi:MAG: DNA primase, partial [Methanoregula sp.]
TGKEVIQHLRNKVPVEYVRDQYFESSAELPPELRIGRPVPETEEGTERKRGSAAAKRPRDASGGPLSLREHIEDVKGQNTARFLSEDLSVVRETRSDEVEKVIETLDASATGLVLDRPVDQKLLDRLVWKGLSWVAARDFRGIIKRPLSIRLLKMGA